jgi:hypothetical protein
MALVTSDGGLRYLFRTHLPGHWQAVETAMTSQGVPDHNFCVEGVEGWVEHKQTHTYRVTLQPTQPGWIFRRCQNGGRVFVAVRRWKCAAVHGDVDELWIVPGAHVLLLAREGLEVVRTVSLVQGGGPRNWSWARVLQRLTAI